MKLVLTESTTKRYIAMYVPFDLGLSFNANLVASPIANAIDPHHQTSSLNQQRNETHYILQ